MPCYLRFLILTKKIELLNYLDGYSEPTTINQFTMNKRQKIVQFIQANHHKDFIERTNGDVQANVQEQTREYIYDKDNRCDQGHEHDHDHEHEHENIQSARSNTILYTHNFTLGINPKTENIRNKLIILFSRLSNKEFISKTQEFFQNEQIANTTFLKIVCETFEPLANRHFVKGLRYEFKVGEFDEIDFKVDFYNLGSANIHRWLCTVMKHFSGEKIISAKIFDTLAKNKLFRTEINACNYFSKIISYMTHAYGKNGAMVLLMDKYEKFNAKYRPGMSKSTNDVKNFVEECNKRPLCSWFMSDKLYKSTETDEHLRLTLRVTFVYDFGYEYKYLHLNLLLLSFQIGKTIPISRPIRIPET